RCCRLTRGSRRRSVGIPAPAVDLSTHDRENRDSGVAIGGRDRTIGGGRGEQSAGTAVAIPNGMTKRHLLAVAAILLTGCEAGIGVEGTAVAPPEVQQLFAAESPGQVFVVAKLPKEPHELRGDETPMLCMAVDKERRFTVTGFAFACAEAAQVTVEA